MTLESIFISLYGRSCLYFSWVFLHIDYFFKRSGIVASGSVFFFVISGGDVSSKVFYRSGRSTIFGWYAFC